MLKLRASDGEEIEVAESVAVLSKTIKYMVEDDCTTTVIPVYNINGKTLSKVLEYCKEHTASEKSEAEKKEFDGRMVAVGQAELYDLLLAANYLEVQGLLDIVVQRVADMIRGKNPEQIRKMLHIKNDFTPEEQEEITRKHSIFDI